MTVRHDTTRIHISTGMARILKADLVAAIYADKFALYYFAMFKRVIPYLYTRRYLVQ